MKIKIVTSMVSAICITLAGPIYADDESGSDAPFSLFGDALEDDYGIKAFGLLQLGFSKNNNSTHDESTGGGSNAPVVGAADEGLQLNSLFLALDKPIQSNILPRITPLPGPKPWNSSFGFWAETVYGRNGLPASMFGFDNKWSINDTPSGTTPGSNRQNYLAVPQLYAQAYFPAGLGMALTVGRFGSGVGHEIPPEIRPGPNLFYTKTYAFVSKPDQVAGILYSANLMNNSNGLLAGELGVVNGRQNWKDNNDDKSILGALRWRSSDMDVWIDYTFMAGNEQNDPSVVSSPQAPTSRIISPRGQFRQHHSLYAGFSPADKYRLEVEALYGEQEGDGQTDTIDILSGAGFETASYSGLNASLSYQYQEDLRFAVRAETFRDRDGIALFPVTAVGGDFNALTMGLKWDANANLELRPEIRYDWQANNNGANAFGNGRDDSQVTVSVDAILHF